MLKSPGFLRCRYEALQRATTWKQHAAVIGVYVGVTVFLECLVLPAVDGRINHGSTVRHIAIVIILYICVISLCLIVSHIIRKLRGKGSGLEAQSRYLGGTGKSGETRDAGPVE